MEANEVGQEDVKQGEAVVEAPKPKMALCIKLIDAPAEVRRIARNGTNATFAVRLTNEFFYTPVLLQDRATCETDPAFLQLLPYIVVQERSTGRVFRYTRGKGGTEERLHEKTSIGIGGHVETLPADLKQLRYTTMGQDSQLLFPHLKEDALRECMEEIGVAPDSIEFVSLIYNPTGVNQVHLGILGIATVDGVAALESGVIEEGAFVEPDDLVYADEYSRLEPWSQAALWFIHDRRQRENLRAAAESAGVTLS